MSSSCLTRFFWKLAVSHAAGLALLLLTFSHLHFLGVATYYFITHFDVIVTYQMVSVIVLCCEHNW